MGGLDPPTQRPRVRAANSPFSWADRVSEVDFFGARTRAGWVAGSEAGHGEI